MDRYAYVVNVEGAVVRNGEYLLIERAAEEEHASGMLAFPGGKVEARPGETNPIESTVRRELAEEVGVEVGTVEYVCSRTFETDTGVECINIVTHCEDRGGDPSPREPGEVATVQWLAPAAITSHEAVPDFLERDIRRVESLRERN